MSEPDQPDRYGPEPKPRHWCETCRGHTGPNSPCYDGHDGYYNEPETEPSEGSSRPGPSDEMPPNPSLFTLELPIL